MKIYYTVSWDNPNGTDYDFTTTWPLEAFGKYMKCKAPYKQLTMSDCEHGTRMILNSKGEDNIDRLHIRHLFNLAL